MLKKRTENDFSDKGVRVLIIEERTRLMKQKKRQRWDWKTPRLSNDGAATYVGREKTRHSCRLHGI